MNARLALGALISLTVACATSNGSGPGAGGGDSASGTGTAGTGGKSSGCSGGEEDCGSGCIDLQSDPENCGACGDACDGAPNAVPACEKGRCQLTCEQGFADCDDDEPGCETDITSNDAHCGACGEACAAVSEGTGTCQEGACVVASCNSPWQDCDGAYETGCETNTQSDFLHCGGCNMHCPPGEQCFAGSCRYATSCKEILDVNPTAQSGIFTIDVDGAGAKPPFHVYCDMVDNGGGWTLVVLTNRDVAGHPNVSFDDARDKPDNVNGSFGADLNAFDYFMGTIFWNDIAAEKKMMFRVGNSAEDIIDIVVADFSTLVGGTRIEWSNYTALKGGIPNIDANNGGYLQARNKKAGGYACVREENVSSGLSGPWFYLNCSNVSPWCTGHGDCGGYDVSMQWRNQAPYNTAEAPRCSAHGEIFIR